MADVSTRPVDEGAFWRVTFGSGKGNVLDAGTMDALTAAFAEAARAPGLKAIILDGAGPDFSFGSSIPEHLPGRAEAMLARFHTMLLTLVDSSIFTLAAIRGRCLGGGLELATMCHRVIASTDAQVGQPEIAVGVFAPVASIALVERIGRPRAEDLCLTGRVVSADEACRLGVVDEVVANDPAEAALAWARTHLAPRSASTLRLAIKAIRANFADRLRADLPRIERLYLDELMPTADAEEGLRAFLEKRPPVWKNR